MTDKIRGKNKFETRTRTGYKGPEVKHMYGSTLLLTSALYGLVDQRHAPADLPPGKT